MCQVAVNFAFEHVAAFLIEGIPFVESQHHGATGVDRGLNDAHILLAQRFRNIQKYDCDFGAFQGCLSAE